MKTRYSRWKVIMGFVGFILIMGVVGHLEQPPPDTSSPQAILEERVYIRDRIKAEVDEQEKKDRIYVAEMERRGRGTK